MKSAALPFLLLLADKPWYRTPEWAAVALTAVYVLLTGFYVVFAGLTLRRIKGQTKATENTAKAAQASAESVLAIERPWILVEEIAAPILDSGESAGSLYPRQAYCSLTVRNFGRTPAKVTQERAELRLGNHPTIPPFDTYELDGSSITPYMLPQQERVKRKAPLQPFGFLTPDDTRTLSQAGSKFLWLCGFLKYRDTFEREGKADYETRFAFRYEPRAVEPRSCWHELGPELYNKAT